MFNSLKYAKKLEEVGLSREQAEMHIQILAELIEMNIATKQDLKDLFLDVNKNLEVVRLEIRLSEQRMTIKLGTIVSIALGLAIALMKVIS